MPTDIFLIFAAIVTLFALFLVAQQIGIWKVCALCAAVFITWLGVLALSRLDIMQHAALATPLMGASAAGIMYAFERKTREQLHVFRLPLFLTLLFAAYLPLNIRSGYTESLLLLVVLWIAFGFMYTYRAHPRMGKVAERIIACCKNW